MNPREFSAEEVRKIVARYADWLRDLRQRGLDAEEYCIGALAGTLHQYTAWPIIRHPFGAECAICDVERDHPR